MSLKTIETTITVLPNGSIHMPLRCYLPPGEYQAVLIIDSRPIEHLSAAPLHLKMLEMRGWPTDTRFHREDLYDDE